MTKFTRESFTEAMERAVELRGADYLYPGHLEGWASLMGQCKYRVSGEPACIIGLALSLIDPMLVPHEDDFDSAEVILLGCGFDEGTAYAAQRAQDVQDAGATWGEALAEYKWGLKIA